MAIDRKKIIADVSKLQAQPSPEGTIWAFGVFINEMPATVWNNFARRMLEKADETLVEPIEELLVNAAHECGYHTGHGIMSSKEWEAMVKPMVSSPEDALHGAFAVCTAFGWGETEITELKPGETMTVRAADYYESDIGKDYPGGKAPRPSAYMLRGVCAAFMDLAYGGAYDPKGQTGLYSFRCRQTKGIESGDAHGEFVVVKASEYEA